MWAVDTQPHLPDLPHSVLFRVKLPFAATERQERMLRENPQVVSGILHKANVLNIPPPNSLAASQGL